MGTLKIDRTLIGGLDADAQGRAIVGSMVALAHELRMRVVAEGVESTSQLDILAGMGCDEVRGYLLARPLEPGCSPSCCATARLPRPERRQCGTGRGPARSLPRTAPRRT